MGFSCEGCGKYIEGLAHSELGKPYCCSCSPECDTTKDCTLIVAIRHAAVEELRLQFEELRNRRALLRGRAASITASDLPSRVKTARLRLTHRELEALRGELDVLLDRIENLEAKQG